MSSPRIPDPNIEVPISRQPRDPQQTEYLQFPGDPPHIGHLPHPEYLPQPRTPPQTTTPPQVAHVPQGVAPPQVLYLPEAPAPSQVLNLPQGAAPPQVIGLLQRLTPPQGPAPSQVVNLPQRSAPPQVVNLPQATAPPQGPAPPQAVNIPPRSAPPQAVDLPQGAAPPQIVNLPRAPAHPQVVSLPQGADTGSPRAGTPPRAITSSNPQARTLPHAPTPPQAQALPQLGYYLPQLRSPPSGEQGMIVDSQPKPSVPMTVRGGDRNAMRMLILGDGLRDWSYGLFGCLADLSVCIQSMLCPCYIYSRNRQRLAHLEEYGAPLEGRVEWCNHDCLTYGCLRPIHAAVALQAITRSNVRRRYGIRGNDFKDVLSVCLCAPCELVQEHREIQLEERSFMNWPSHHDG